VDIIIVVIAVVAVVVVVQNFSCVRILAVSQTILKSWRTVSYL